MHILWNGGSCLQLNALLIQPFQYCSTKCNGCYVQALKSKLSKPELHLELIKDILGLSESDQQVRTNQLTISMNTLPKNNKTQSYQAMSKFWIELVKLIGEGDPSGFPKIHLTFRDVDVYTQYSELTLKRGNRLRRAWPIAKERIELISLSNINALKPGELNRISKIRMKVNWNWMPDKVTAQDLAKTMAVVYETMDVVDSAYMILKKNALGQEQDKDHLRNLILIYNALQESYPELISRITVDNCIQCAIKYNKHQFGCSANISMMHVWPNGQPTGCPYNTFGVPKPTVKDFPAMVDKMYRIRSRYEFDQCKIPKLYREVSKNLIDHLGIGK